MKIFLIVPLALLVGCANIPPGARDFAPEIGYSFKSNVDPFGIVSKGLQVVQSTVGQPCPTANTNSTYKNSTEGGVEYKVDCTR